MQEVAKRVASDPRSKPIAFVHVGGEQARRKAGQCLVGHRDLQLVTLSRLVVNRYIYRSESKTAELSMGLEMTESSSKATDN